MPWCNLCGGVSEGFVTSEMQDSPEREDSLCDLSIDIMVFVSFVVERMGCLVFIAILTFLYFL